MAEYSTTPLFPVERRGEGDRVTAPLRVVSAVLFAALGGAGGLLGLHAFGLDGVSWWLAAPAGVGALGGYLGSSYVLIRPIRRLLRGLRQLPNAVGLSIVLGLTVGLLLAALLAPGLWRLPDGWGVYTPVASSLLLGLLGGAVGLAWSKGRIDALGWSIPDLLSDEAAGNGVGAQILMDTSAIIDGRIADIGQTGFIAGPLLIPRFVLDELRHIADSSDPLRRNRGRRGLEMLNKLRKDAVIPIRVIDMDVEEVREVDAKLVRLAKRLRCSIVTTDYNLNRVAELQGVRALNVNELANSLRPVVLPSEEMSIQVLQEGREHNQGIAFLDDGTMIVVEGGRRYIGSQLDVVVSRVLQTAAGRIIFSHPRDA